MVSRRGVLLAAAATALMHARVARAQPVAKMLRVGFVGIQARDAALYKSFLGRMAELGYHEGRNFTFEYQQAPSIEGYEAAFRELATRKIDIFLAAGSEPSLRAVRAVAGTTPIAFLAIDFDPLAKGYVASLTRPGANITGILVRQIELAAKRIELVRQVFPNASRVGLLFDTASREQADSSADAARSLGFDPVLIEVKGQPPDYVAALRAMDGAPGQPIVLPASPLFIRDRTAIANVLLDRRLPSMCAFRENAAAGALMSYGIDLNGLFIDIADYVDRIARGQKPAEMPIEQSTRFFMAVNLKTAAALALSLPMAFTARANEVFE
jgi:putative tryptophan/tyrosine transport system substrate-binding protein